MRVFSRVFSSGWLFVQKLFWCKKIFDENDDIDEFKNYKTEDEHS